MKVLHLVAGELNGGAARGAYWLHCGLKDLGVDSKLFSSTKSTMGDDNVISTSLTRKNKFYNILRQQLDRLVVNYFSKKKNPLFSTGMFGYDFTKSEEYKDTDIIHLHWINGSFINIKDLSKIDKPVVWTLRDMWPITGGCHYSMGCDRYKSGCGHCPQLASNTKFDISKYILNRKKKHLAKDIKLVGISNWLSDKARESYLFRDFNIRTIFNNIDTKVFFPVNKRLARDILDLKTGKKIILVGSVKLKDFYKGFGKFQEAVKRLEKDKYLLCFFGEVDKTVLENLGLEYKSFGYLYDNISLRLAYSSADVFVAPSLMDAFGKTLAESMACGTPVVCFNATGPIDIVDHKVNGYKAVPFESVDLAHGIDWVLNNVAYQDLCNSARQKVLKNFDSKVVAQQYIALYDEMLNETLGQFNRECAL